jgi:hypothetical protein
MSFRYVVASTAPCSPDGYLCGFTWATTGEVDNRGSIHGALFPRSAHIAGT